MSDDMRYIPNAGSNPLSLANGYSPLSASIPKTIRDNLVPASDVLTETQNGGFLGRTENQDSESAKA